MFESENISKESSEVAPTKHFKYLDKRGRSKTGFISENEKENEVVFECDAKDILEADVMYKEATGNDVSKQGHVGCEIVD
jgi:hypothetical protein